MFGYIFAGFAAFIVLLILIFGYVKAPPDNVFIISGVRKRPRMIVGKASFRIPFLERMDRLSLRLIPIDVKTASAVPTADYINIKIDAAINVKISNDPELLQLAAQNFLNRDETHIATIAREVLEGNMREIVGQMFLKDMVSNRQLFADKVKENSAPDLAKMGLDIVSFNVQNFIDNNGVIEDLGVDNITRIKKDAAIARAESERDVAIAQADAMQKSNDAKVVAEMQIAEKNTQMMVRKAELKQEADIKQAAADAAYRIEEEQQRKTVEISSANADIAKTDREIELKNKQVAVEKETLDAQIRIRAEADRFARQQLAEAELFEKQKEADARKYLVQQEAEAQKAKADSEKYIKQQEAEALKVKAAAEKFAKEQEAAGIAAIGLAEAEAIKAKGLAEAEGIDKKALAMKKMEEAAVLEMYFKVLPEVVKNAAAPLAQVDKMIMFGEGNSAKLVGDIMNTTTQVVEGLKESTGVDLQALLAGFVGGKAAANAEPPTAD